MQLDKRFLFLSTTVSFESMTTQHIPDDRVKKPLMCTTYIGVCVPWHKTSRLQSFLQDGPWPHHERMPEVCSGVRPHTPIIKTAISYLSDLYDSGWTVGDCNYFSLPFPAPWCAVFWCEFKGMLAVNQLQGLQEFHSLHLRVSQLPHGIQFRQLAMNEKGISFNEKHFTKLWLTWVLSQERNLSSEPLGTTY